MIRNVSVQREPLLLMLRYLHTYSVANCRMGL